ncbi:MAG TPA: hypothetical protein VM638_09090 [Actinomycetota bacterium]|nr:hypothetical protein [Actinomycetota bacterium]
MSLAARAPAQSRRSPWLRLLAVSVAAGAAATYLAGTNAGLCTPEPESPCATLVRMLSLRVGIVTMIATALALLTVAGLARTMRLDEERRLAEAGDLSD